MPMKPPGSGPQGHAAPYPRAVEEDRTPADKRTEDGRPEKASGPTLSGIKPKM